MRFNEISLKTANLIGFATFGAAIIVLSLFSIGQFRNSALEFQRASIDQLLDAVVQRELQELEIKAAELGEYAQRDESLESAFARAQADAASKDALIKELDQQFHSQNADTGALELRKVRVYDTDLRLVAESSAGVSGLAPKMAQELRAEAASREGADGLKRIGALWVGANRPLYSALIPIGDPGPEGYLEIVTDPLHQLKDVSALVGLPVRLRGTDGKDRFSSDGWDDAIGRQWLEVSRQVDTDTGQAALSVAVMTDLSLLEEGLAAVRRNILAVYAALFIVGTIATLWIMNRLVYRPISRLIRFLEQSAGGDLTGRVERVWLRDVNALIDGANALISRIRTQVSEVAGDAAGVAEQTGQLDIIAEKTREATARQRAQIDQVATAMTEMATTVQEVARNAANAAEQAHRADGETRRGGEEVRAAAGFTEQLTADIDQTSRVVNELGREAGDIDSILDVIRGISEQTNLLALNAAIEAARAGEQGRGFAVVADEVRNLSMKTQESAMDIQRRIEKLQESSRAAVEEMRRASTSVDSSRTRMAALGELLGTMEAAIAAINDLNTQIASAADEQSAVADEITRNVVGIKDGAEETAQHSSLTGEATGTLAGLSEKLKSDVSHFRV